MTNIVKKISVCILGCLALVLLWNVFLWKFLIIKPNLDKFRSLTIQDPLFYDPGLDLKQLEKEIQKLTIEGNKVVDVNVKYKQNSSDLKKVLPKGWRLWPDRFLTVLPAVGDKTKQFTDNPTRKNAVYLLEGYEAAVTEYQKAATLDIEAIQRIFKNRPEVKNKKILFLGSATTPQIVYEDFLLVQRNSRELKREILLRKICLNFGFCPPSKSVSGLIADKAGESVEFSPLPENVLGVNSAYESLAGPFRAATRCFGTSQGQAIDNPFFIKVHKDRNEDTLLKPMLSNTKYYKDFRKIPNEKTSQYYMQKGILVKPHAEVNDYLCTDLRYIPELMVQYLKQQNQIGEKSVNNKLAVLPYLIRNTLSFSSFVTLYPEFVQQPLDPLYLITNRSAYSLYFGTFTPSIWRIGESPVFLLEEDFQKDIVKAGFIQYQDLVREGMSQEDIIKLNSLPRFDEVFEGID